MAKHRKNANSTKLPKVHKEVRAMVEYAESFGFMYAGMQGNDHIKLELPDGGPRVVLGGTPKAYTWKRNAEADIRRKSRQWDELKREKVAKARAEQKE